MSAVQDDAGLPDLLPEADRGRWTKLNEQQQALASVRLAAFRSWRAGELDVDRAAEAAGLSRSRFYRLAAEWRSAPSLAALGVLAGLGGARARLDPDAVNALQAKVAEVVRLNADASVAETVRHLIDASGVTADRLPGAIKLREIVEAERRRVAATHEAGHAVQFDCSAINLPRDGGRPHILFACLDVGTGLVLGAALGVEADEQRGYPAAAVNARARLAGPLASLPWAHRLARVEMTAGADLDRAVGLVKRLEAAGVVPHPQLARRPRRYGRYIRAVAGARIGRVEITPARTEAGSALPDNGNMAPWTAEDAIDAVLRAFDDHNAALLAGLRTAADGRPPDGLVHLLRVLAEAGR